MRKITFSLLLCFAVILIFYCKKSTETEPEEDIIKIEVLVRENGIPTPNLFVIIEARVQESVRSRTDEIRRVISYEITQEDQLTTNNYGKAIIEYRDKSIPERNGIVVEKVTIKKLSTVMLEDFEEKFVEKGTTLNLEYDI